MAIPKDELERIDGVQAGVRSLIPDQEAPREVLAEIDKWLERFQSWGLNPTGIRVADFDWQFYVPNVDLGVPFRVFSDLILLAFQHKQTGKAQGGIKTAFPPGWGSHYPTATTLVGLAQRD